MRVRQLLVCIVPLLIVGVPTVGYILERRAGAIPTQAEWESAAHSSGPWAGSGIEGWLYALSFGGIIVSSIGASISAVTGRHARFWVVHLAGIIVASAIVFVVFGWLFE